MDLDVDMDIMVLEEFWHHKIEYYNMNMNMNTRLSMRTLRFHVVAFILI